MSTSETQIYHRVVFMPSGKRGDILQGTNLLDAARQLGVDLDSVCGGRSICGRCQIVAGTGNFSKFGITVKQEDLPEIGKSEIRYRDKRGMEDGRRLACQCRMQADMVVDVPADSQVHQQVIRKRAEARDILIDPIVRPYYIGVEEPDMDHPSGDLERVIKALEEQWEIGITKFGVKILPHLQAALRKGEWKVTVAVRDGTELLWIWPGFVEHLYGVAIDLGSTTISVHLTQLDNGEVLSSVGAMNPQIRFGEDLMSRVSYVMMNPGGEVELTTAVRQTLNKLCQNAIDETNIEPTSVIEAVLVGNPVMHHLALGINPTELGWAPFALASNSAVTLSADDLQINSINPLASAYFLPCIAGHVGADAAAVVLSEAPEQQDELTLIVDIGTNAEIIMGDKRQLLACSSPTGPALEGAQISCGQRAAAGAIDRVRIDPTTYEARLHVIGVDPWSDEEGFTQALGSTGITGVCGSGIIEAIAEMFLAGIIDVDGNVRGELAQTCPLVVPDGRTYAYVIQQENPRISITQQDIRAIQLAKGALYAGAKLLQDMIGEEPQRIILAGAFGSHIDAKYAMILGLIPDCDLDKVYSVGNAAGTGARIALLNKESRHVIEKTVRDIRKIETATASDFQEFFVDAMAFPNKTDGFPKLRSQVTMPPINSVHNSDTGSTRRRNKRRNNG